MPHTSDGPGEGGGEAGPAANAAAANSKRAEGDEIDDLV